uniref:Uncharacterized protein n=1 Tax=Anopheles coluzzii TaxID=1518534 RepID=A0A8W7PCA1_ANOCL
METMKPRPIRANTFKLVYEGIARRPSRSEVIDFIDTLKAGEVVTRIQLCTSTAIVYVETETMQQAELIVAQHQGKHFLTIDGTSYPLPILLEDGATEVRLHELPPYVTGAEIEAAMCCFGKVVSITEMEYGPDSKVPGKKPGLSR